MKTTATMCRAVIVAAFALLPLAAFAAPPKPSAATEKVLQKSAVLMIVKSRYADAAALLQNALRKLPAKTPRFERNLILAELARVHYAAGNDAVEAKKFTVVVREIKAAREIELANRLNDGTTSATILGYAYQESGKYPEALVFYKKALAGFERSKDVEGQGAVLSALVGIYDITNARSEMVPTCERFLLVAQKNDDMEMQSEAYRMLGNAHEQAGHFPQALPQYHRALVLTRARISVFGEVDTMHDLMRFHYSPRNPERDGARAIFWGKQAVYTLRSVASKGGDAEQEERYDALMVALQQALQSEERVGEADTVRQIAATKLAVSDSLPLTADEEALRKAYLAVAAPVTVAAGDYLAAEYEEAPAKIAAAKAKRITAQNAFAAFLQKLVAAPAMATGIGDAKTPPVVASHR